MFTPHKKAPRLQKRGARVRFRSVLQSICGAVAITVLFPAETDYTGAVLETISNLRTPRAGTDREKGEGAAAPTMCPRNAPDGRGRDQGPVGSKTRRKRPLTAQPRGRSIR